jgi:iron complex transport system substrate-binding protein
LVVLLAGCAASSAQPPAERIVAVGGTTTELVYALGAGERLVGVDTSSAYPEAARRLPQVGYQRTLSAEGILSLRPTLLLIAPEAGPAVALEQLAAAGVRVARLPGGTDAAAVLAKIRAAGRALGRDAAAERLAGRVATEIDAAVTAAARAAPTRRRVLFLYSRGGGVVQVGGRDTPAAALLALAGGENAVDAYAGYRPLSPEALVAAAPEVILVPRRGLDSLGGREALLALPGVALTPAGRAGRVVAMDDLLLLGFGPRLGEAIAALGGELRR